MPRLAAAPKVPPSRPAVPAMPPAPPMPPLELVVIAGVVDEAVRRQASVSLTRRLPNTALISSLPPSAST